MIQFSGAKNDYGWMSNFYRCDIRYKDLTYKSSEAAWQAQKTLDEEVRKTFQFMTPAESKRAGRKVTLRPDWESVKYSIMVDVLTAKFSQNVQLLNWLMLTGEEQLLENTTGWHDNTWGDCSCPKCKNITGQNLLGKALMEVRASFAPVGNVCNCSTTFTGFFSRYGYVFMSDLGVKNLKCISNKLRLINDTKKSG